MDSYIGVVMSITKRFERFFQSFKVIAPYLFSQNPKFREATEEYPDFISSRLKTGSSAVGRGFLYNDLKVCTGCGDCDTVCPSFAINMNSSLGDDGSVRVAEFSIDFSKCVLCGICEEICPVNSLRHSNDYEMVSFNKNDMKYVFTQLDDRYQTKQDKIKKKIKQIRSYEVRR